MTVRCGICGKELRPENNSEPCPGTPYRHGLHDRIVMDTGAIGLRGNLEPDEVTPQQAYKLLGDATFYLAGQYPFIKNDVHAKTPERRACEIIIACKDLLEYTEFDNAS